MMKKSKKRKSLTRALAVVLSAAMLVTSSGFQVLAEDMNAEAIAAEQAAAEEAARIAAEQQAAEEAEAARIAAEQQAAEEEAARIAAEQQAAEEAEAARIAAEQQAAEEAAAAEQARAAEAAATANTAVQTEEGQAVLDSSLVLKAELAEDQELGGYQKVKVTYELGEKSAVSTVETRLYIGSKTAELPQFDETATYVNEETNRSYKIKTDADENMYVEYLLKAGEKFTEEFLFGDTSVKEGETIEYNVVIGAFGDVPAENTIQETPVKVIYTLPEETSVRKNVVTFSVEEGASAIVEETDVTNATATAKDGTIYFCIKAEEGYAIREVLVDGTIPARTTGNADEYIIEGIQTDATIVSVATEKLEAIEEVTEEVAEEAAEEPTEEVAEEAAEEPTEEIAEEATEEVTEEIAEEPTAENEEETTEPEEEPVVEYGTSFVGYGDGVTVYAEASLEAKIPADAVLVAELIPVGSEAYLEAVATMESQMAVPEGYEAVYEIYDVYFLVDGQEIEPEEGLVTVYMEFNSPILTNTENKVEEVSVIHISDDAEVTDVTDSIELNNEGTVDAVGFSTDSFSIIAARGLTVRGSSSESTKTSTNFADYVDSATLITSDGNGFDPDNATANNGWVTLEMEFSEISGGRQFPVDQELTYDITNNGKNPLTGFNTETGNIVDSNGLKDASGQVISYGTYKIDTNGRLTVIFNENVDKYYNLAGKLTFAAQFKKSQITVGQKTDITFPGDSNTKTLYFKDGSTVVGKKTAASYDAEKGGFLFIITLKADAADQAVTIVDTMGENLVLDNTSIEISPNIAYSVGNKTNSGFTLTMNPEKDTEYKITYFAKLKDGAAKNYNGAVKGLENSFTLSINGGEKVTIDGPASYTHVWVEKSNKGLDDSGKISWVLTANPSADQKMTGITVSDTLKTDGINYDTSSPIKVVRTDAAGNSDNYELKWSDVTVSSDGKSWSYVIPEIANDPNDGRYSYQFTYETNLENSSTSKTYTNTGKVGNFSADSSVTLTAEQIGTATGTGTGIGINKNYEDIVTAQNGAKYAKWVTTLTIPTGTHKNVYYMDELYGTQTFDNTLTVNKKNNAYSDVLVTGLPEGTSITIENTEKSFKLSFGEFTVSSAATVTISYYSKIESDGAIRNIGVINSNGKVVSNSASTNTYDYSFSKNGSYNSATKEITWTVVLQDGQDLGTGEDIVVTDTFSANQSYIANSAEIYSDGTKFGSPKSEVVQNNQVTFTIDGANFSHMSDKRVELVYKTKLNNNETVYDKITTTNTATVSRNGKDLGKADATYEIPSNVLDKKLITDPSKENGYQATYTVEINKNKLQLLPDGATNREFVIKDTIADNMDFVVNSLELKQDGTIMDTSKYTATFNQKELVITIPDGDGHSYVLTYGVSIHKKTSSPKEDVEYSNKVTFEVNGKIYQDSEENHIEIDQSSSSGMSGSDLYFLIYKYDQRTNSAISDVTFELYKIENENDSLNEGNKIGTATTGNNGYIIVGQQPSDTKYQSYPRIDIAGGLVSGTRYALKETSTKDGYVLDDTVYYFTYGLDVMALGVKFISNVQAVSVEATKKWDDKNNLYGTRPSEITFTLYETVEGGTEAKKSSRTDASKTLTVKSDGTTSPAKATWTNLPMYDSSNNKITYTVKETSSLPEGYGAVVSADLDSAENKYVYEITNAYTSEFVTKEVTKQWEDDKNRDGKRPESITLKLYYYNKDSGETAGSSNIDYKEVSETFLEKYSLDGAKIQYRLNEQGNLADYTEAGVSLTGNMDAATWSCEWENLPKYIDGKEVVYEVKETQGATGYTADDQYAGADNKIINTYTPETISKTVTKSWSPANDTDNGNRPDFITVQLYQQYNNGTPTQYDTVQLSSDNNWTYTWENLPKYVRKDGVSYEATYTVKEGSVNQYETTYYKDGISDENKLSSDSATTNERIWIVNTYNPDKISISAKKVWIDNNNADNMRPASITLTLQKSLDNGKNWKDVTTKTLSRDTSDTNNTQSWNSTVTWSDLVKYENKVSVKYRVVETAVTGYTTVYSSETVDAGNIANGGTGNVTITNTHGAKATLSFEAKKTLVGNRSAELKAAEFEFVVEEQSGNQWKQVATGKNDGNGNVSFEAVSGQTYPFEYTSEGTHTYRISEVKDSTNTTIQYSDEVYTVVVNVTLDSANGKLVATPTIKKNDKDVTGSTNKFENVVFTNTYQAQGSGTVEGTKTLTGKALTAGEFTFGLFDSKDATTPISGCTGTNDANGNFSIKTPVYTQADIGTTKTYYLKELVDSNKMYYQYDRTVYVVKVSISDAGNGKLQVETAVYSETTVDHTAENKTTAAFTNNYIANGSLLLTAVKTVTGRGKGAKVPEFEFNLYKLDSATDTIDGKTPIQTVKNTDAGAISFAEISYSTEDIGKEYFYAVTEQTGTNSAYTYDAVMYIVKVKVEDGDQPGGIKATPTYYKTSVSDENVITADSVVFSNEYKAKGSIQFTAKKKLEGKALLEKQFTFNLYEIVGEDGKNQLDTVENASDGTITFKQIEYTQADIGTHTYRIEEVTDDNTAYTYAEPIEIKVVVAPSDHDTLIVEADKNGVDQIVFTNKYQASVDVNLTAKKVLKGKSLTDKNVKSFQFQLLDSEGSVLQTKTNASDGSITFDKITYTQEDIGNTYTYTLKEVVPSTKAPGYTYDATEHSVSVKITDPSDNGQLTAEVTIDGNAYSAENPVAFVNSYEAEGKIVLSGTKKLTGTTLHKDDFTFVLTDKQNKEIAEAKNAADGSFTFEEITYTQNADNPVLGEHVYYIYEKEEEKAGYGYDASKYQVTVMVTDNGDKTLNAEVSEIKVVGKDGVLSEIEFNNTYLSNGSIFLSAEKVLKDRVLEKDQFIFELYTKDSNGEETVIDTKRNDGNGKVTFKELTYTQEMLTDGKASFVYFIREVNENKVGYEYDSSVYKATVSVKDDGNGSISTVVTYENADGNPCEKAEFNNTYKADGSIDLSGTKKLTGNKALQAGLFQFVLKDENGNIVKGAGNQDMIAANDASGKFIFPSLVYSAKDVNNVNREKDFVYYLTEMESTDPENDPYTYSDAVYKITVTVKDTGNGSLNVSKKIELVSKDDQLSEVSEIEFTNHYNAKASLALYATKTTNIALDNLEDNIFSFKLSGSGENQTKFSDPKTGVVNFDAIEYDESDIGETYFYTIIEISGRNAGYQYSNEIYHIKVKISDSGNGVLKTDYTITDAEGNFVQIDDMVFRNEYKAEGTLELEAVKKVEGKAFTEAFEFELKDSEGKVLQTKKNDTAGYVKFDAISYTQADIGEKYSYTVSEKDDQKAGYTYSTEIYTVEVQVKDAGNGKLNVVSNVKNSQSVSVETMTFVNAYAADSEITLYAEKELTGAVLKADQFSFELKDEKGNVLQTKKNAVNGNIAFDTIKYDEADAGKTFQYTIQEVIPEEKAAGYTYDETKYEVQVTVTDNGDGTLKTTQVITRVTETTAGTAVQEVDKISFNNSYHASGEVVLEASKVLKGTEEMAQFTFELKDAETQKQLQTASNDEKGKVVFKPLTYTEADAGKTYVYKVSEVNDEQKGYVYDDVVYTVEVTVEDNGDGTITAVPVYKNAENESVKEIQFVNTFIHFDVNKVELGSGKELTGALLKVYDSKENLVDSWTSKAGETHNFGAALKPGESYVLKEDLAPTGYGYITEIKFSVAEDGRIEISEKLPTTVDANGNTVYLVEDAPIEVEISKVDITDNKELEGAVLQILNAETKEIATTIYYVDDETTPEEKLEWTSDGKARVIKGLPEGKYILREITAPTGYAIAEDVEFTVSAKGEAENKVVMKDAPTEVMVSKTALTGLKELAGAHLEIRDKDGKIATTIYGEELSWVSGTEAKQIKGLAAGTYTLTETLSPEGYAYAEDVTFTVTNDGKVTKVVMKDDITKVTISKYDVTNEKELAGAHLVLKDSSGTIVADWFSTGKPKVINGQLIAGEEYTLSEVSAPTGYDVAKDITFTVNTDGTVNKVVMEDKESDGLASVIVQKLVMQDNHYIAVDYTFYTALFADEACTERVTSVKPLHVSGSYTTSTIFTKLPYGTYYVAETDEYGNVMEEDFIIESIVVLDGKAELTPSNAMAKSTIINGVAGFDSHYYKSGEIIVNKEVVADGEEKEVNESFYFALFTDAALTNLFEDAGVAELRLENASNGTVVFKDLPLGTYYLAETDEDGVPVGSAYKYDVTIDSSYCNLNEENMSVERNIVNTCKEEKAKSDKPTTGTSITSVKTSDDTPVLPYAASATASMLAMIWIAVCGLKRRRKNNR